MLVLNIRSPYRDVGPKSQDQDLLDLTAIVHGPAVRVSVPCRRTLAG